MKYPFRFWMTSCEAVVMSALGGARGGLANERQSMTQSSRYRITETIERIEASAQKRGLSVFARVDAPPSPQWVDDQDEIAMIVFESSDGGTPVVMEGPASQPEVPLTVCVRANAASGETEVLFSGSDWGDLPPSVERDLTELPMLVADALE